MTHFSRAAELARAVEWQMDLAISRNPHLQKAHDMAKLPRLLNGLIARLQGIRRKKGAGTVADSGHPTGITLGALERVMGKVKATMVTREEWETKRAKMAAMKRKAMGEDRG
jgi:hypothetical protein